MFLLLEGQYTCNPHFWATEALTADLQELKKTSSGFVLNDSIQISVKVTNVVTKYGMQPRTSGNETNLINVEYLDFKSIEAHVKNNRFGISSVERRRSTVVLANQLLHPFQDLVVTLLQFKRYEIDLGQELSFLDL